MRVRAFQISPAQIWALAAAPKRSYDTLLQLCKASRDGAENLSWARSDVYTAVPIGIKHFNRKIPDFGPAGAARSTSS